MTYFKVRILDKNTHSVALRPATLVSLVKKHDHVLTEVQTRLHPNTKSGHNNNAMNEECFRALIALLLEDEPKK